MIITSAFLLGLAQTPATPIQESHIRSTLAAAVKKMGAPTCDLVKPRDSDLLVVVGTYQGRTIPTASVAGQDEATLLSDIAIKKGSHPIYLALTSFAPTIWRLTGDVKRVRHVAIVSGEGAGVIGVPREHVQFATGKCDLPYNIYSRRRSLEHEVPVLAIFGRRANVTGGEYGLYRATISDTAIELDETYSNFAEDKIITRIPEMPAFPTPGDLEGMLRRNFPPVIAEVEPSNVVAAKPVERYEILPMTAGLVSLEKSGALKPATATDVRRWKDRAVIGGHVRATRVDDLMFEDAYRVTRPIRLPAGLCGAYSLTLFVRSRDDVKGDPCHSNIYVDDGTIMAGTTPTD